MSKMKKKAADSKISNNNDEKIDILNEYAILMMEGNDKKNIPTDIMFPDELNCYLREQIHYYAHENAMVMKNLSDLESEYEKSNIKIAELEQKLNKYETIFNKAPFVTSNQVATTKIIELTKKLREKASEVESLKTKCSRLEKNITELKKSQEVSSSVDPPVVIPTPRESESEIKKLQEKLNHLNNKLAETRNLNLQLKNDLKLANKWLQQEIGETFESLQTLNNSNNNWRGRAQVILDLQQKNNDLKEKLKCSQVKLNDASKISLSSKDDIKIENLTKENNDLKQQYEDLKKKYEGSKARCRVLDSEFVIMKSKLNMLQEQSERDQQFIETLSSQLSNTSLNSEKVQKDKLLKKVQTERNQLLKEVEHFKDVVKRLKEQIIEKDQEIENMKKVRASSAVCNDPKRHLNNELQNMLNLIEKLNTQLSAERDAHSKTQICLRIEKQKATKAEAFAAKVELDSTRLGGYSSSSVSVKGMDSSLADQLEIAQETIKALHTRLELEQFERKSDLKEFGNLLQYYESHNKEI